MRKLPVILALLLAIPLAGADWFYNSRNILTNVDISSSAEIEATGGYVESAEVNLTFFPKQTETQEVTGLYTKPKAEETEDGLKFSWKNPENSISFEASADVKTTSKITEVNKKIEFPIKELPADVIAYTKATKTIDSENESIILIASELVKGEDDLYAAVFKVAGWTKNNIEYNLSTLTAEVSQKASWVLENRQGVCDELTSLFIAMLRAVGVPARFVSGIAYTNSSLFSEDWGAHGWAEVYFPGYGWVPFDVTYGEFGWIDPTHIKFKESFDSDEPSTPYRWTGRNAELKTKKLDIKVDLISTQGHFEVPLKIESSALKKVIGFGSYNFVEATIENPNAFYYSTEVFLSKPKEVSIIGSKSKNILLLPGEKKKAIWILKLEGSLDSGYSYTFPLLISTLEGVSSETSFDSNSRGAQVSLEEIEQTAKLMEEEEQKEYSSNVAVSCNVSKDEFYEYEDAELKCNVKNTGNVFLDKLDVCFEAKCNKTSIGISQEKKFVFEINKSYFGNRESPVTLRNELVSKVYPVSFKVNDRPKIGIGGVVFPVNVSYDEKFTVSFTLAKKSLTNPRNIAVFFTFDGNERRWSINELPKNQKFELRFAGSRLNYGKNDFGINVDYYDGLGKKYNANEGFSVWLTNATLLQRVVLPFNAVGNVFENAGYETIAVALSIGSVVFIGVIWMLFRRGKTTE